jgi:hypothetical protein
LCNSFTLIVNAVSVILFARRRLNPLYVLVVNALVLAVWVVILAASNLTSPGWTLKTMIGNIIFM